MTKDQNIPRLLYNITESAALLGIGRTTLYELIAEGQIPVIHIGKARRISARALDAWIKEKQEAAP